MFEEYMPITHLQCMDISVYAPRLLLTTVFVPIEAGASIFVPFIFDPTSVRAWLLCKVLYIVKMG